MFKKLEKTCRRKFSEVSFQFASWPSRHFGSKPVTVSAIDFKIISRNAAPLDSIISTFTTKMLKISTISSLITLFPIITKMKMLSALKL